MDYRARINAHARRLRALGIRPSGPGAFRVRISAQAVRLALTWRDDPGACVALDMAGASGLATLLRMRNAAQDRYVQAVLANRGGQ